MKPSETFDYGWRCSVCGVSGVIRFPARTTCDQTWQQTIDRHRELSPECDKADADGRRLVLEER